MLVHVHFLYGTKGAQTHVQQHGDDGHTLLPHLFQQLGGKMQTRCGGGGRAFGLGVDRLIAVLVGQLLVDIRGQRHLAQLVQQLFEHALIGEAHHAAAGFLHVFHDGAMQQPIAEAAHRTRLQPTARTHQRFPVRGVDAAKQQHLHGYAGVLLHAQQTGGDDLRLIDDQRVTGIQIVHNVVKMLMLNGARVPVQHHQAAVIPGLHGEELLSSSGSWAISSCGSS